MRKSGAQRTTPARVGDCNAAMSSLHSTAARPTADGPFKGACEARSVLSRRSLSAFLMAPWLASLPWRPLQLLACLSPLSLPQPPLRQAVARPRQAAVSAADVPAPHCSHSARTAQPARTTPVQPPQQHQSHHLYSTAAHSHRTARSPVQRLMAAVSTNRAVQGRRRRWVTERC